MRLPTLVCLSLAASACVCEVSAKRPRTCSPSTLDGQRFAFRVSGQIPRSPTLAPTKKGATAAPNSLGEVHRDAIGYMVFRRGKIVSGVTMGKLGSTVTSNTLSGNYTLAKDCVSMTLDVVLDSGRVANHIGLRDMDGVIHTVQTNPGTAFVGEYRRAVQPGTRCNNATLQAQTYVYNGLSEYNGNPFAFAGYDVFDGKGGLVTHYNEPQKLNQMWPGKYTVSPDCIVRWYYDSGARYIGVLWEKAGYFIVNVGDGYSDLGTSYQARRPSAAAAGVVG